METAEPVKVVEVDDEELCFPFTRIAGQEEMKRALLLTVVDPRFCGGLITVDRGTGKSTVVRSLSDLLPDIATVKVRVAGNCALCARTAC